MPDLFKIFAVNIAIVGPRPLLIKDMVFMNDEQRRRHTVRQGLTGLAQVNGRNSISWEQKLDYDLKYIQHVNLFKDIAIIFKTAISVFKRSGVVREGTQSDIDFGDWLLQEEKITQEEYDEKVALAKSIAARRGK